MSPVEPLALSPREAAAYLSISKRTLSRLIRSKTVAARKAGLRRATRHSPRAVRRPHAHGSRARSPSLKCQRAHTPQIPSASGFDRVVPLPTR